MTRMFSDMLLVWHPAYMNIKAYNLQGLLNADADLEKQTVSCKSKRYCILSRVEDQNATCSGFINFFFSFFLFFNKTRNIFPVLQYLTQAPSGKNAW